MLVGSFVTFSVHLSVVALGVRGPLLVSYIVLDVWGFRSVINGPWGKVLGQNLGGEVACQHERVIVGGDAVVSFYLTSLTRCPVERPILFLFLRSCQGCDPGCCNTS